STVFVPVLTSYAMLIDLPVMPAGSSVTLELGSGARATQTMRRAVLSAYDSKLSIDVTCASAAPASASTAATAANNAPGDAHPDNRLLNPLCAFRRSQQSAGVWSGCLQPFVLLIPAPPECGNPQWPG